MSFVPLLILASCHPAPVRHRIVVDLAIGGFNTEVKLLGNLTNLVKAFKNEPTAIEVVCHDGGIDFLTAHDSVLLKRMEKLSHQGVLFVACQNSLRGRKLSKKDLVPFAHVVAAGVAEIVLKEEAGWSYLKAAY